MKKTSHHSRIQHTLVRMFPALILLAGLNPPAKADDYGCQVMLCMANPKGPRAEPTCRPPIDRLIRERALRRPPAWPTCDEAKPSTMAFSYKPYDPCPAGTTALPAGQRATMFDPTTWASLVNGTYRYQTEVDNGGGTAGSPGSIVPGQLYNVNFQQPFSQSGTTPSREGIGEGDSDDYRDGGFAKVCVAKQLGTVQFNVGILGDDTGRRTQITSIVYESVTLMGKSATPRVADIYIDGKLYMSTRF